MSYNKTTIKGNTLLNWSLFANAILRKAEEDLAKDKRYYEEIKYFVKSQYFQQLWDLAGYAREVNDRSPTYSFSLSHINSCSLQD